MTYLLNEDLRNPLKEIMEHIQNKSNYDVYFLNQYPDIISGKRKETKSSKYIKQEYEEYKKKNIDNNLSEHELIDNFKKAAFKNKIELESKYGIRLSDWLSTNENYLLDIITEIRDADKDDYKFNVDKLRQALNDDKELKNIIIVILNNNVDLQSNDNYITNFRHNIPDNFQERYQKAKENYPDGNLIKICESLTKGIGIMTFVGPNEPSPRAYNYSDYLLTLLFDINN